MIVSTTVGPDLAVFNVRDNLRRRMIWTATKSLGPICKGLTHGRPFDCSGIHDILGNKQQLLTVGTQLTGPVVPRELRT